MSDARGQNNLDRLSGLQDGSEGLSSPASNIRPPQFSPQGSPGLPPNNHPEQAVVYMQRQNGMGIAALVLGIIGMVPFPITGFWCSLLAIIFGAVGRKRVRQGIATNKVMATWGLWLGIVGMGIQALLGLAIAFG